MSTGTSTRRWSVAQSNVAPQQTPGPLAGQPQSIDMVQLTPVGISPSIENVFTVVPWH